MAAFEELGLIPEIGKALDEKDWLLPTDVQAEAIPLILGGGDVLMAAETGSGKTGAFCLPIVQIVWETLKELQSNSGATNKARNVHSSNKMQLSFFDRGNAMAITPDGLRCQSREMKEWHGCRGSKGVCGAGKYYYEAKVEDEGLCRVGWSTQDAGLDLGTDKQGFGFGGTGKKSNNRQFDSYGEPFGLHDVIGCFLDLDNKVMKFSKNGQDLGEAFRINDHVIKCGLFPAVCLKNAEILFNFGDTPFKYPPSGYSKLHEAQPKYTIKNSVTGSGGSAASSANIKTAPQAIIIEPSRELAEQTFNALQSFKKHVSHPIPKEVLVIGGYAAKDQISEIQEGVDIIVGTPGRLEDFINQGILSLTQCRFFVLDEVDGLLQQGHQKLIVDMHKRIPKITSDGRRLQMIVCSATLHSFEVKKLAEQIMHFPTWVDLKGQDSVPDTVHHVVLPVDPQQDRSWQSLRQHIQTDGVHAKDNLRPGTQSPEMLSEAVKLLKGEYCVAAINKMKMDHAIIFCRTKLDCDNLERYFQQLGGGPRNPKNPYSCVCLHGDRKPQERSSNLEKFKRGQVKFLICTDVAARGIDIGGLPFMINMTLPDEKSNYVHRIGRVGRAERMGLAISFKATVPEKVWFHGKYCATHGRNCWNTELFENHGCCIWYNENQYLADIEEHLGVTIAEIGADINIPVDDFDGKVSYGAKRANTGSNYQTHCAIMAPTVEELAKLEKEAQIIYLKHYISAK